MNINDFDFDLPEELIAQTPLEKRSESRLLILDPKTEELEDRHFYNIIYLSNFILIRYNQVMHTFFIKIQSVNNCEYGRPE